MARSSRFQPRSFPQRNRRMFTWIGGTITAFDTSALAAGASTLIASIDTRLDGAPQAPYTVVRVRGMLQVFSDQVLAVEAPHGAYGIAVVNGEAFDAGVASIPTPFTESFDDRWLYHTYWNAVFIDGVTAGEIDSQMANIIIDGKAMRKVDIGDVIVFVIENGSSVAGATFLDNVRTGVKLH